MPWTATLKMCCSFLIPLLLSRPMEPPFQSIGEESDFVEELEALLGLAGQEDSMNALDPELLVDSLACPLEQTMEPMSDLWEQGPAFWVEEVFPRDGSVDVLQEQGADVGEAQDIISNGFGVPSQEHQPPSGRLENSPLDLFPISQVFRSNVSAFARGSVSRIIFPLGLFLSPFCLFLIFFAMHFIVSNCLLRICR